MFIAIHYVKINGVTFTPGEYITEPISAESEARFLDLGAIRHATEAPFQATDEGAEEDVDQPDNGGAEGSDGAENDAGDDAGETEGTEDEAAEEYEDAEPMEIDVSESITPAEEPAPQEDKKPARKRKGGKE